MSPSPLDNAFDALRIRQYFNAVTMARELADGVRRDATFLRALRRAVLPLPGDPPMYVDRHPFPRLSPAPQKALHTQRVALLTTGGSGALASLVGAARAFEEAGIRPAMISVCSGAALFGFPIAAGRSAEEVARATLGLSPADLVDVDWQALLKLLPTQARGFNGFLRGDRIEAWYREWLGDMTLAELPIPCYAPVWNVERNRVEYLGPRTHPDLTVARAVRIAVSLPLFIEAVRYRRSPLLRRRHRRHPPGASTARHRDAARRRHRHQRVLPQGVRRRGHHRLARETRLNPLRGVPGARDPAYPAGSRQPGPPAS